jgi:phage terminase large subunit-like protein
MLTDVYHGHAPDDRLTALAEAVDQHGSKLLGFWQNLAHPGQLPPHNDWRTWLLMAGRGFGKTRAGAEWVRDYALRFPGVRIALVGATFADVRRVMIEGESGLLNIGPAAGRPRWEPSNAELRWPNGSMATVYSAASPDKLRGPQHHIAWCDEIAKWARRTAKQAWSNLQLGLRLGDQARAIITSTPRAVKLLKSIIGMAGTLLTRGKTQDNENLSADFRDEMERLYAGTRWGRQELDGELIEDVEGALWSRALIEQCRTDAVPQMKRVVIGVDPPASVGGDACGIVVVGLGVDDKAYVLADCSVSGVTPEGWARAVANAADIWSADRVVAEANNGGNMVESILRAANIAMPIKRVHAAHGKTARAEPVFTLYQNGRTHHAGAFPALEDELCGLITGGGYEGPGRSPDRADALVWACSEIMLGKKGVVPRARVL